MTYFSYFAIFAKKTFSPSAWWERWFATTAAATAEARIFPHLNAALIIYWRTTFFRFADSSMTRIMVVGGYNSGLSDLVELIDLSGDHPGCDRPR